MKNAVNIPAEAGRAPRRIWILPALLAGLMGLQISLSLAGVYAATSSKSFAVESNYYDKALHWDDEQAAERASAALGWQPQIEMSAAADRQGNRELVLTLKNNAGEPLDGATVNLIYFHHARAAEVRNATLRDLGQGHYAASLPLARTGIWEFRMAIQRGAEKFLHRDLREVTTNR